MERSGQMSVPAAIFPPLMGLFGLGLAMRRLAGAEAFPAPQATAMLAELMLGATCLLGAGLIGGYFLALLSAPGNLRRDLAAPASRTGVAAMVLCVYLAAAALAPYWVAGGQVVLWLGLALHLVTLAILMPVLVGSTSQPLRVAPGWHLHFVGFIVAALAAIGLGLHLFAMIVFIPTALLAVLIWSAGAEQLIRQPVPPPARPALAIHLSPAALLGLVADGLGFATVGLFFAAGGALIALLLLVRLRWLLEAGFSPAFGAFTFPLAAIAGLWLSLDGFWFWPGLAALLAALVVVPWIFLRILRIWLRGALHPMPPPADTANTARTSG